MEYARRRIAAGMEETWMPSVHCLVSEGAPLICEEGGVDVRIQIVLPTITIIPPCVPVDMMLCMAGC